MPDDGAPVRIHLGRATGVVLGSHSFAVEPAPRPGGKLDLLAYGHPYAIGIRPGDTGPAVRVRHRARPGFLNGRPGLFWTVNGHQFPDVPMFVVGEGDVIRIRISNRGGEVHPMHLHGHTPWCSAWTACPPRGPPGGWTRAPPDG
jgi:hypothetical protein